MAQIKYPIGMQSFRKIREDGYVYVDKTEYIHRLVTDGKYYFLSRPRRFGKSLLLSTIEDFFLGNRSLFENLAISRHEHDWEAHPVLHLDLSGCRCDSPESIDKHLGMYLSEWERKYGAPSDGSLPEEARFREVIINAHRLTGKNVVILVDEYDKPLLETVENKPLQDIFRNRLRAFYSNLKSQDAHIRFAMLTGVTKFGHLSIFSDLNNLNDISLDREYHGICGITTDELHEYFDCGISEFAKSANKSVQEIYDLLKSNYDGYHFSPETSTDIYNPFSLLNCLNKKFIRDYWFSTGTPTFLIKMILANSISIQDLSELETSLSSLTDISFDLGNPIPVLYQSGYLTIKSYDPELDSVLLGFPNKEVERGFLNNLLLLYTSTSPRRSQFSVISFIRDLQSGNADTFMERLKSLFADFPYDSFNMLQLEQHYQDVIYILAKLMGFSTHVEYMTANGRIDLVIKTKDYIYVFEFKIDKTPEQALAQIDSKDYLLPFQTDSRKLIKIGVNFSSKKRLPDNWKIIET